MNVILGTITLLCIALILARPSPASLWVAGAGFTVMFLLLAGRQVRYHWRGDRK